jgi:hypothetical protein
MGLDGMRGERSTPPVALKNSQIKNLENVLEVDVVDTRSPPTAKRSCDEVSHKLPTAQNVGTTIGGETSSSAPQQTVKKPRPGLDLSRIRKQPVKPSANNDMVMEVTESAIGKVVVETGSCAPVEAAVESLFLRKLRHTREKLAAAEKAAAERQMLEAQL